MLISSPSAAYANTGRFSALICATDLFHAQKSIPWKADAALLH